MERGGQDQPTDPRIHTERRRAVSGQLRKSPCLDVENTDDIVYEEGPAKNATHKKTRFEEAAEEESPYSSNGASNYSTISQPGEN